MHQFCKRCSPICYTGNMETSLLCSTSDSQGWCKTFAQPRQAIHLCAITGASGKESLSRVLSFGAAVEKRAFRCPLLPSRDLCCQLHHDCIQQRGSLGGGSRKKILSRGQEEHFLPTTTTRAALLLKPLIVHLAAKGLGGQWTCEGTLLHLCFKKQQSIE